jgi:acyl-CoA dehydrogenase
MRADRLLAVVVPAEFGGPGLGVGATARIVFHVARVSGSAGLIYAMHMSQALSVVRHGRGAFFEDFQRRMVQDQILIASGTSEKGVGGDIFGSICSVEEAAAGGDGLLAVTKESPNISYVDHAGALLVSANRPTTKSPTAKGRRRQVLIVAEAGRTAFSASREAQFLGMRGILNKPWDFTARFPEAAIFAQDFPAIARATMTPSIQIFWAALWSGIAWTVLDRTKRFVGQELPEEGEVTPVMRHELTRLINRHYVMNALIRDAIAEYDAASAPANASADASRAAQGLGFGLATRINRLKIVTSECLNEICQGAIGIGGIRGYATDGPYSLAEPLADALSAPIMVSNFRLAMNTAKLESLVDETL